MSSTVAQGFRSSSVIARALPAITGPSNSTFTTTRIRHSSNYTVALGLCISGWNFHWSDTAIALAATGRIYPLIFDPTLPSQHECMYSMRCEYAVIDLPRS